MLGAQIITTTNSTNTNKSRNSFKGIFYIYNTNITLEFIRIYHN